MQISQNQLDTTVMALFLMADLSFFFPVTKNIMSRSFMAQHIHWQKTQPLNDEAPEMGHSYDLFFFCLLASVLSLQQFELAGALAENYLDIPIIHEDL